MTLDGLIKEATWLREKYGNKKIFFYEDGKYPLTIEKIFIDKDGDVGMVQD